LKLQSEKGRPSSSNTWWLCCFLIADVTRSIKTCFAQLQGKTVALTDQTRALNELKQILANKFEDTRNGSEPAVDEVKTELVTCASSPFSEVVYKRLSVLDRHQLVLAVMDAARVLIDDIQEIQIEVLNEVATPRFTLPAQVIDCSDSAFSGLVDVHRRRLREHFAPTILAEIWNQRKDLRERCQVDTNLRSIVDSASRKPMDQAWNEVDGGKQYSKLRAFVVGIGSIPPGTHTVEGDFSDLERVKNDHRRQLTNHALEGHLQAAQYFELMQLAQDIGSDITSEDKDTS